MGRNECVTNENKPHRTSAGRLGGGLLIRGGCLVGEGRLSKEIPHYTQGKWNENWDSSHADCSGKLTDL